MDQDEIYLIDLWRLLAREWRWFAALFIVAVALAFAYTRMAHRQWEATAWIQIGQVGQAPAGQDTKVEPLLRVIERLQTRGFQDEVLQGLGVPLDQREGQLYRKSFKLEPSPYAGLIKLTVRADSPGQARQLATATVEHLQAIHQHIEAGPLKLAQDRLAQVHGELQNALADRDRLQQLAVPGKGGADSVMAGMLLASKNTEVHELQQAYGDLQSRLSASYTFETSQPWPVYVPDRPSSPNLLLAWGIGILAGLFLGAFAAVGRHAIRQAASA
ncbi:Wzz/FepE/Etk N-terminal domain-containing protein [Dyella sp.]|uniref:Wzz/FepE/Etk N-terminal domain-containing protein n=1 Tax=Dyella sp. TaxID=1869338 RepID=UPI002ED26B81